MPDGWEYDYDLDMLVYDSTLDPYNDGLDNIGEYQNNTDPNEEDTNGDTWNDGDEVDRGTDPLDPNDYSRALSQAISGYYLIPSLCLIYIIVAVFVFKKNFLLNN